VQGNQNVHEYLSVVLLAILQGIAEFLPVSSSGHLVIAANVLHVNPPGVRLEMMLHVGTLVSICLYYRQKLQALILALVRREAGAWSEAGFLLLATLPAVAFYFLAREWLETVFEDTRFTATMLLVTGCLLLSLKLRRTRGAGVPPEAEPVPRPVNFWRAVTIGVAQAFAILPGISRSGATIVTARHLGIAPRRAAEFSFLMSIPPLMGGALLDLLRPDPAAAGSAMGWGVIGLGVAVAAVVGYLAIVFLMRTLTSGRFWIFGLYCLLAGSLVLLSGL
jgi:undecaprenyl-diphosphatase